MRLKKSKGAEYACITAYIFPSNNKAIREYAGIKDRSMVEIIRMAINYYCQMELYPYLEERKQK
jgi:hypothetical protein